MFKKVNWLDAFIGGFYAAPLGLVWAAYNNFGSNADPISLYLLVAVGSNCIGGFLMWVRAASFKEKNSQDYGNPEIEE